MKQLTAIGKAKYFGRFVDAFMSVEVRPGASVGETAAQLALLQDKFNELIGEVWDKAYNVGYTDGKKVGIFDDQKN